ncbi:hypothetical protein CLAIMM_07458 [Cladophialophora immunda]|nr:hypothetical protein CLAIMM_07458 [Cladophialophora immunda]
MPAHNLTQNGQPQTQKPKPIPWLRVPPDVASTGSPLQKDSNSDLEILGDIVHEENDSMQISLPKLTKQSLPDAGNVRKRPVPTARKDEWEDSSDEDEGKRATDPNRKKSKSFRSGVAASLPNRGKPISRPSRFHKLSKTNGTDAKELSQSKTAVDFRKRREVEEAYRQRVCAMIDDDILQRVDAEGGITPVGRMYKAVYTMMERQTGDKEQAANRANHDEVMRLRAENQAMKAKIDEAIRLFHSA